MAWTYAFDTATPAGTDAPATLDNDARTKALALQERLNVCMYFPLTGTAVSDTDAGKMRQALFQAALESKPTLDTGESAVYPKLVGSVVELFYEDSAGTEKQLTSEGSINISSAELLGILANATYFTAIDEAGTGTVDLIKAGKNEADDTDVAILPDETRLASSAAPTEDTQVPNKKYVDDQIAALAFGTWTGTDSNSATLAMDEVYLAGSDGFVTVALPAGNSANILTSGVNPPTTARGGGEASGTQADGCMCPVKSGDYVKVTQTSGSSGTIYWLPKGSGSLVKQ